jgi:hypothetical protein
VCCGRTVDRKAAVWRRRGHTCGLHSTPAPPLHWSTSAGHPHLRPRQCTQGHETAAEGAEYVGRGDLAKRAVRRYLVLILWALHSVFRCFIGAACVPVPVAVARIPTHIFVALKSHFHCLCAGPSVHPNCADDWVVDTRSKAVTLLCTSLVYLEEHITQDVSGAPRHELPAPVYDS